MVTIEDVRAVATRLPRAYEALVRDRVKFRVGRLVFLAFSSDEQVMGFGFPKEQRAGLVAAEPDKFLMPRHSDMRYNWVRVRLACIDHAEMEELVLDAWRMCVPKSVAAAYLAAGGERAGVISHEETRDVRPGARLPRGGASPMAAWPQARRPL